MPINRQQKFLQVLSGLAMVSWLWRPIRHAHDLWWHLATGRYIVENHILLRVDIFSSTAHGHPWINHEWLYQIVIFLAYRFAGIAGIELIKIILIVTPFAMLLFEWNQARVPTLIGWATAAVAFWASRYAWFERADLVSIFFLCALTVSLRAMRKNVNQGLSPIFWAWPLGFALWANMHGGFAMGLATMSIFVAGVMLERRQWIVPLAVWAILCVAATLLNPWGYELHLSLINGIRLLREGFITEWMKTPWTPLQLFWICLGVYWTLFCICYRHKQDIPWSTAFTSLFLSILAIRYVRNVPYFMLGAFPVTAEWLSSFDVLRKRRFSWVQSWGIPGAVLITILFIFHAAKTMASGIDPAWQPVQACSFIESTTLPGHFFNDYEFGGYWIWRFGTSRPVFIDGRLHTVEGYPDLYRRIQIAKTGPPAGWQSFLESYGVDAAMVANPDKPRYPVVFDRYFPRKTWALVYWDDVAMIFLKRLPSHTIWIGRYERPRTHPSDTR